MVEPADGISSPAQVKFQTGTMVPGFCGLVKQVGVRDRAGTVTRTKRRPEFSLG
jgi:hypothetical protein